MTLLAPIWLFLLLPLGLALWLWRPPTKLLVALRLASLLLVVFALAGLSLRLPSKTGTVVVIADRSLSMPATSSVQQKEAIDILKNAMTGDDRLAVVSFGQQVAVEQAPSGGAFGGFNHQVGGNASSLCEAVETALSLIPKETPGRLLVLSDGKWTGRDPLLLASTTVARYIAVDYRSMDRPAAGDLAVARIDAPSAVSVGESYLLTGWVFSPTPQAISFVLKRGDQVISKGKRQLNSGMNRLPFRDRATQVGNQDYTLNVTAEDPEKADDDPVPENNTARFLVGVNGPRPLLHVAETPKSGLARLLKSGGLDIRVSTPDRVRWNLETLSRYSGVILENVPAEKIGHVGMETLAAWVRATGAGLLLTGGKNSYAPGGYYQSPIDPILPVSMELRNEHRKLSLAIAVVLDRSGSMQVPVGGGKVKMDLANLGTASVLDLMGPQDEFGCIAVDTACHTIAPLEQVRDKGPVRSKILSIQSMGGGIYIYEALAGGADMLLKAKAGTKHIILFADANDSENPADYRTLMEKIQKAGITVSVIGLGSERDKDAELLKDIAKLGKGRIFFSDKPEELPRLFAQDTFVVARNTFIDEVTKVKHMPGLATLTDQVLPSPAGLAVGGYNLCYAKTGATVASVTLDEYKAPLAAAWRAGAGRVVCYTGEADGSYAGAMARWDKVGDYYTSLARWTAGAANPLKDNMLLTQEVRDGVNVIQLHLDPERKGESFAGLPKVATLRSLGHDAPRVERSTLRWTGADTLAIEVPLDGGETTLSTVEVPGYDAVPMSPVCLPYSPEFKPAQHDRGLVTLEKLGRATGGVERIDLAGIWRDLPRQVRYIPIARYLLLLAVLCWLAEVLERRTGLLTGWRRQKREEFDAAEPAKAARPRLLPQLPRVKRTKAAPAAPVAPAASRPAAPAVVEQVAASPPTTFPEDGEGIMEALRKARKRARGRTE
jgi:Mg-chelatase subunit ChlD